MAEVYKAYFKVHDERDAEQLALKKFPAVKASEIVKKERAIRRAAESKTKTLEFLVEYYEHLSPFLIDLKEEVEIPTKEDFERLEEYTEEEQADEVTKFLTKDEYRELSQVLKGISML